MRKLTITGIAILALTGVLAAAAAQHPIPHAKRVPPEPQQHVAAR